MDVEKFPRALALILAEVARLRRQPVGPAELRRAKDYVTGQLRISLEGAAAQMAWAADNLLNFDRFIQPDEVIAALQRVTADDLQRLANEVLRPECLSAALIAPTAGPAELKLLQTARARLA